MKILVYGAGVLGSIHAAALHQVGHEVSLLARGERLEELRSKGVLLASGESADIRSVPVPVVEMATGPYELIVVLVRTHQVEAALEAIADVTGNVLLLANWAGGVEPLVAAVGDRDRLLLGYPTVAGTMDGGVIRYRPPSLLTRFVSMPVSELDGVVTPRLVEVMHAFRTAGINSRDQPRMDAWLKTHAAFEVPLARAVRAAGGPRVLADDADGVEEMIRDVRLSLAALPMRPVPRGFNALQIAPAGVLMSLFTRFLRSSAATPLGIDTPAAMAEVDRLAEQLAALGWAE
ncbi:ketopantoate reductase family protein [Herbiconiux daphne]|uniref:Ketopantoate reductase N-terminal domain-containing protein n=1 Tax=Herbiconiux daphne TaxID=2970914 RepID=A0ABT2H1L3_9MICO|nr:2-dehydropantoate 2-reductase N-terminal domain-containing protein [Herbiconiux daphne]MCS5733804.1 hypothetical protein [Herbiconiux daphne]